MVSSSIKHEQEQRLSEFEERSTGKRKSELWKHGFCINIDAFHTYGFLIMRIIAEEASLGIIRGPQSFESCCSSKTKRYRVVEETGEDFNLVRDMESLTIAIMEINL
ncbi:hypothetical protein OIU77_008444 [Salix suchowensis]|uniref:Uncharacterized protein n=1 Tax=Salix suchowensis TaxID=1278906 RepID=A0ABQ9ALT5_9ROSI|nr:hypothetical protein OIU77_008444 [Salix suchowensis]